MKEQKMKIWKIALLVEDLQAAEDFYTGLLGMEVLSRGPKSLYVDAGNVQLELIRKEAFEGDPRLGVPGIHHLSFKVDDIDKETEKLKAKGAKFFREPFEPRPGIRLAFFDGLNKVNLQLFDDKR